jgi:hypothetical protein
MAVKTMSKKKKKKKKSSDSLAFIDFMEENINIVRATIHTALSNTPLITNHLDYRWVKSKIVVHALVKGLGFGSEHIVKQVESMPYDILFNNTSRVSLKMCRFSQHPDKRSMHPSDKNEPGWIILKNIQNTSGRERSPSEEEWDYLMAIDRQDSDTGHGLTLGIIHIKKFLKLCKEYPEMFYQSGDQIKIQLYDDDWSWFSTCPVILPEYSEEELENIDLFYRKSIAGLNDKLLKKNRITPNKMFKILNS